MKEEAKKIGIDAKKAGGKVAEESKKVAIDAKESRGKSG